MNLSPSTNLLEIYYDLFDKLIKNIQLYAGTQGYAICHLCIKKLPYIGLLEICYLCYNWRQKKKQIYIGQKQKYDGLYRNNCPFIIVAKSTNGF